MSINCTEKLGSPTISRGQGATATLKFIIMDDAGADITESEALSALASESPLTYSWMIRKTYSVSVITEDKIWLGTCVYSADAPDTDNYTTSFSTTGKTERITQSLSTASYALSGWTAPDYGGAIGVTPNGVEGVDAVVPAFVFSETHYFDTSIEALTLRDLTGTVNADVFRDFDPGEVLFEGAEANYRSDLAKWEVVFYFRAGKNRTAANGNALTIGSITNIDKKAWDYLWVRYEPTNDATAGCIVQTPVAVFVETVYESGDFSLLGI